MWCQSGKFVLIPIAIVSMDIAINHFNGFLSVSAQLQHFQHMRFHQSEERLCRCIILTVSSCGY